MTYLWGPLNISIEVCLGFLCLYKHRSMSVHACVFAHVCVEERK